MAEINIRTYIQEVDNLIEEGHRLDEAIAHCRHILKSYPKHIDTYRLLGKAYLETKRYGDAGDIFQRVLSAVPDDFISHVGMAIIREDEGNLDASIWHMERASEAKPGNPAIEEELKRLVGKRDGVEPQRVRPTRGALARMYYHGELFSYATSELRAALEEDPDRPDLQLLLADTYWRTDQRLEAANLCGQILEKLPYCTGANKITAYLLQTGGRPEEAAVNLRRLIALDPYMAFIDNPMDDPDSIDASAVQLERLAWSAGQPLPTSESSQPDWAASLGVDFRSDEAKSAQVEEVPSWLQKPPSPDLDPGAVTEEEEGPPIHPFAGAKPPPGADIPEWMRDAGWVEGTGEATEGPAELADEPEQEDMPIPADRPLERADLPSWLSEVSAQSPAAEEMPIDALPTDLPSEDILPIPEMEDGQVAQDWQDAITPEPSEEIQTTEDIASDLFGTVEEPELDLEPVQLESPEAEDDANITTLGVESFLNEDVEVEDEIPEFPPWLEPSTPGATDTIISWLGDKSLEDAATTADDIPTWMKGTGPLDDSVLRDISASETDLPLDIFEDLPTTHEESTETSEPSDGVEEVGLGIESVITPSEVAPEWLDEVGIGDQGPSAEDAIEPDEAPEWLAEPDSAVEQAVGVGEEASEWLEDLDTFEFGETESETSTEPASTDWLSEVIREDILPEEIEASDDVKPDWLEGFAEAELAGQDDVPVDSDEHPEWLSEMSLVEEVDTSPETPEEEHPQWLKGLADSELAPEEEAPAEEEVLPDWISEESFPEEEDEIKPAEVTPQWLQDLSDVSTEIEEPSEEVIEPSESDETVVAEAPDWLQEFGDEPDETIAVETREETPKLASIDDAAPVDEAPPIDEAVPTEETPDWLQDFEEAPVEALVSEVLEETPELTPIDEATPVDEEPPIDEAVPMEEAPDWLIDFGEEPVEDIVAEVLEETPEITPIDEATPVDEEPSIGEAVPIEETPDWLMDFGEAPVEAVTDEVDDEAPEWLQDFEDAPVEAVVDEVIEETTDHAPIEEATASDEVLPMDEAPDWLMDFGDAPVEAVIDEVIEETAIDEVIPVEETLDWLTDIDEPSDEGIVESVELAEEGIEPITADATIVSDDAVPTEEAPDWLMDFGDAPLEAVIDEVIEETAIDEVIPVEETLDWLTDIDEPSDEGIIESVELAEEGIEPITADATIVSDEAVPTEEAPDWLQEFTEPPIETTEVEQEIVAEVTDAVPTETTIPSDWMDVPTQDEVPSITDESSPIDDEVDWLMEIEESEMALPPIPETTMEAIEDPTAEVEELPAEIEDEPSWQPEFADKDSYAQEVLDESTSIDPSTLEPDFEDSFDWLQETAREVTPEPELDAQISESPPSTDRIDELAAVIDEPLDDDTVDSFLESLAAREETSEIQVPPDEMETLEPSLMDDRVEDKLIDEHIIPEELDESLVWLEQLAGEEPVDEFQPPIFVEESEDKIASEVPDWLEEVAEKPEDIEIDSMEFESDQEIEESVIEPILSETDPSSMETIISRRPLDDIVGGEEDTEDLLEEADISDAISRDILPDVEPAPASELSFDLMEELETPESEPELDELSVTLEPEVLESEKVEEPDIVIEEPAPIPTSPLETARSSLENGDVEKALSHYSKLIEDNTDVNAVIEDLKNAIERTPQEPMLWQTLGDALMKAGQLSDAIDAYRRGMEAV